MTKKINVFIVEVTSENNPQLVVRMEFSKLESARKYVEKQRGAILLERKAA